MPRSYQVTASDPRAAADDTTDVGQTNWSTATLRVSPPPTRDLTGQAGHHRPTTRTVTLTRPYAPASLDLQARRVGEVRVRRGPRRAQGEGRGGGGHDRRAALGDRGRPADAVAGAADRRRDEREQVVAECDGGRQAAEQQHARAAVDGREAAAEVADAAADDGVLQQDRSAGAARARARAALEQEPLLGGLDHVAAQDRRRVDVPHADRRACVV